MKYFIFLREHRSTCVKGFYIHFEKEVEFVSNFLAWLILAVREIVHIISLLIDVTPCNVSSYAVSFLGIWSLSEYNGPTLDSDKLHIPRKEMASKMASVLISLKLHSQFIASDFGGHGKKGIMLF